MGFTQLIHMCDMTHSYVWHDSFICLTWLIHMCDMTHSYVWHDSFVCVTCIHTCDMTHSYAWRAFICVTWLIHTCDMSHSYVWHDSFVCVTCFHMCDMTHSYMWHVSFVYVTWLIRMRDILSYVHTFVSIPIPFLNSRSLCYVIRIFTRYTDSERKAGRSWFKIFDPLASSQYFWEY